jgi:arylformamidase
MPHWPGDRPVLLECVQNIADGDEVTVSSLACSLHTGTHVDAPSHFIAGGESVDELPLDILVGRVVVVELAGVDVITADLLEGLKLAAGTRRLLLKTDNSELWSNPSHPFKTDFTALSPGAARWLVDAGVNLIGIDYLSIQRFEDPEPQTHRTLLEAGVIILEGLDLRSVGPGPYNLICLPMKLIGCEGAPVRAILIQN